MNDQQKKEQYSGARDQEMRAALDQHWAASDANDFETEHRISCVAGDGDVLVTEKDNQTYKLANKQNQPLKTGKAWSCLARRQSTQRGEPTFEVRKLNSGRLPAVRCCPRLG
jgi:hypothetical protein